MARRFVFNRYEKNSQITTCENIYVLYAHLVSCLQGRRKAHVAFDGSKLQDLERKLCLEPFRWRHLGDQLCDSSRSSMCVHHSGS